MKPKTILISDKNNKFIETRGINLSKFVRKRLAEEQEKWEQVTKLKWINTKQFEK